MTAENDPTFESLLHLVKEERGFDFTGYKRASLMRRVQRRMQEVGVADFETYHDFLLMHPGEFTALFNTILINVTAFFRDPDAWQFIREEELPRLLSRREGQPVRAWSAGCATGEEAYTLAMVLADAIGLQEFRDRVKIYATDVDEEALRVARLAAYSERDLDAVPEEFRERFFEQQGQRFVFRKELRRSVIFGRNDLVQDAPISHVDILVCRNTLMYFNADTQDQILRRMHFALRPNGILLLGKAEMLLSHSTLFQPFEMKRRVFRKIARDPREQAILPARAAAGGVDAGAEVAVLRYAAVTSSPAAQMVLDREGRLALASNRASHLFGLSSRDIGRPIQDLEVSYRPIELRAPIEQAMTERRQVWVRDVSWSRGTADPVSFDIQVLPLTDDEGHQVGTSIVFNDVTHFRQLQRELQFSNRQLETAYEELQSTNEELETTNEELQSTVEELETTNEELQSTNEELETMNEELQSMNDELHLANEGQEEQQQHLYRLSRFMSSILGSMSTGVVVVDEDLTVVTWNAKSEDLWGVRADEAEGARLFDLDIGLPWEPLRPVLARQLADGAGPAEVVTTEAVNRRGRRVTVQVTTTRLLQDGGSPAGALLVMDADGGSAG